MVKVNAKAKKPNKCAIADLEAALGLDSLEDEAAPSSSDGERLHGAMSELQPLQDETAGKNLSDWFEDNGDAPEDDAGDDDGDEDTAGETAGETVSVSTSSAKRPVAAECRKRSFPQACRVCLTLCLFPTNHSV